MRNGTYGPLTGSMVAVFDSSVTADGPPKKGMMIRCRGGNAHVRVTPNCAGETYAGSPLRGAALMGDTDLMPFKDTSGGGITKIEACYAPGEANPVYLDVITIDQ